MLLRACLLYYDLAHAAGVDTSIILAELEQLVRDVRPIARA